MSNAEHLIENAICTYEEYGNFDLFLSSKTNEEMAEMENIRLSTVTEMAFHVLHVFKPEWIEHGHE